MMLAYKRITSTFRSLFRKEELDRNLDDELRSYLDHVADEKIGAGASRSEAYRQARIELGGVEQVKEKVRDRRLGAHLDVLLQDVRYALRTMRKNAGFTATCLMVLAAGIGATAALFSVVDSVLLEPLPYPEADRLVWMWSLTPDGNTNSVAALDYADYRAHTETVEELAAYSLWQESYVLTGGDAPEVLTGAAVETGARLVVIEREFEPLGPLGHGVEHLDGLIHNLQPYAVTRQNCYVIFSHL